ncbi:MAG: hypothetical protein ACK58N_01955, partial [Synechocystis sp.]
RPDSPSPPPSSPPHPLSPTPSVVKPVPRVESPSHPSPDSLEVLNPSQTRKAIEQFAKNFAGQVIVSEEVDTPLTESEAPKPSPSLKKRPVGKRPPIVVDNIEDLPF